MKTIVCDLDETLIHAFYRGKKNLNPDLTIKCDDNSIIDVVYRPHLDKFINYLQDNFNIIIWTSATRDYASRVVDKIFDKKVTLVTRDEYSHYHRISEFHIDDQYHNNQNQSGIIRSLRYWGQDPFWYVDKNLYIKPLKFLLKNIDKNLQLKDIIAIDDDPYKFYQNYGNYWCIPSFNGDNKNDDYLLKFIKLIDQLKDLDDVRVKKDNYKSIIK